MEVAILSKALMDLAQKHFAKTRYYEHNFHLFFRRKRAANIIYIFLLVQQRKIGHSCNQLLLHESYRVDKSSKTS